ncbi:MAG: hypothetical protein WCG87_02910 [Bacteroidota bacterium]
MRLILLTAIALLTTGTVFAQYVPEYRSELGFNSGLTTITTPSNTNYTGRTSVWNNYSSLRFSYGVSDHYLMSFEMGATSWTTRDKWPITGRDNANYGIKEVKYVFGKPALSFMIHTNRVVPFYSRYREMVRSQFYFGLSGGLMVTVNDGQNTIGYNTQDSSTYTKEFHYDSGIGYVVGFQLGYSYFVTRHFGFNIEGTARYANVNTADRRYGSINEKFDLTYFPVTLGLRYRW